MELRALLAALHPEATIERISMIQAHLGPFKTQLCNNGQRLADRNHPIEEDGSQWAHGGSPGTS